MKLTFLGTAAAEGVPALWCECEYCARARANGGRDLRRRASYLVDDDTLIDLGPDFHWQTAAFNVELPKIERLLISHIHADHLYPADLLYRRSPWFSLVKRELTLIAGRHVFSAIIAHTGRESGIYRLEDLNIAPLEVAAGDRVDDRGMSVAVFAAEHAPGKEAQFFALERGGRRILIANDTGIPSDETWGQMGDLRFDLAAIDSTMGLAHPGQRRGHMGVDAVVEFRDRLAARGCIGERTPVYATHFSHNGHAGHAELEAFFNPRGIQVAYDGLVVDLD